MSGTSVNQGIGRGNAFTGGQCLLYVGDMANPVAYFNSVTYTKNIVWIPLKVIGLIGTKEFVPADYSVSGSISGFRNIQMPNVKGTGSPTALNWVPKVQDLTRAGTIRLKVFNSSMNRDFTIIDDLVFTDESGNITQGDVSSVSLNFMAKVMWDESGPQNLVGA